MVGVNKKTKTRTEREPPEGGFGYFVAFGLAISQVNSNNYYFHTFFCFSSSIDKIMRIKTKIAYRR